ncbi:MAG: hypothetical protein WGN25_08430 [Candidatus Electrothrix sp. GW3-4]|uniref:hypothetical protein n=1 Tax=Candidatus Electrothrix sp. GW3-4 TaxID=3126740 RepID=UPI0030D5FF93
MDDGSGLLVMIALIVVVLVIAPFLKPKPKRNPFIVDIEEWLGTRDQKYKNYFEIDFPKKYPEFKCWDEGRDKKK